MLRPENPRILRRDVEVVIVLLRGARVRVLSEVLRTLRIHLNTRCRRRTYASAKIQGVIRREPVIEPQRIQTNVSRSRGNFRPAIACRQKKPAAKRRWWGTALTDNCPPARRPSCTVRQSRSPALSDGSARFTAIPAPPPARATYWPMNVATCALPAAMGAICWTNFNWLGVISTVPNGKPTVARIQWHQPEIILPNRRESRLPPLRIFIREIVERAVFLDRAAKRDAGLVPACMPDHR